MTGGQDQYYEQFRVAGRKPRGTDDVSTIRLLFLFTWYDDRSMECGIDVCNISDYLIKYSICTAFCDTVKF